MTVLTRTPRYLTVMELTQYVGCRSTDSKRKRLGIECSAKPLSDQPEIIHKWFDQWCGEASVQYGLHADDNRDELWQKFCEEVGR